MRKSVATLAILTLVACTYFAFFRDGLRPNPTEVGIENHQRMLRSGPTEASSSSSENTATREDPAARTAVRIEEDPSKETERDSANKLIPCPKQYRTSFMRVGNLLHMQGELVPTDLLLLKPDWDKLHKEYLAYETERQKLYNERSKLAEPVINRKLANGQFLLEAPPLRTKGVPLTAAEKAELRRLTLLGRPQMTEEIVQMRMVWDKKLQRDVTKYVYVRPGDSQEVDAASKRIVNLNFSFGRTMRSFFSKTRTK